MKRGVNILDKHIVYDESGAPVRLAGLMKSGGEGEIFRIDSIPGYCAKIFYEKRTNANLFQKITAMVSNPPGAGLIDCREKHGSVVLAWPHSLLFDSPLGSRNFIGYTMPLVDTDLFREAHCYYDPQDRIREFGGAFSWRYLLTAAYNLATVIDDVHQHGHCVADFSGRNILIARTAAVAVIDCDSFQIRDSRSGRLFPSVVGTGEYMPPELMGHNFAEEHLDRYFGDIFGLAVMVFKLIMGGIHPFQAGGEGVSAFPGIEQKIKNGVFAFASPDKNIYPPSFAPDYRIVPPSLRRLFSQCFVDGIANPNCRPTAAEWKNCLLSEVVAMKHCKVNVNHWYGGHLEACPWCKRGQKDIFPAESPLPPRKNFGEMEELYSEQEGMSSSASSDSLYSSPSPAAQEGVSDAVKFSVPECDVTVVDSSSGVPEMDSGVPDESTEDVFSPAPVIASDVPDELAVEVSSPVPVIDSDIPDELAVEVSSTVPVIASDAPDESTEEVFSPTPVIDLDISDDSVVDVSPVPVIDLDIPDESAEDVFSPAPVIASDIHDELAEDVSSINPVTDVPVVAPAILIPQPHMSMHDVARGITIPCRLPVTVTGDSPLLIKLSSDVPWIEIPELAVPIEGEGGVHVILNTGNMSSKGFQNGRVILDAGEMREEIFLFVSVLPEF